MKKMMIKNTFLITMWLIQLPIFLNAQISYEDFCSEIPFEYKHIRQSEYLLPFIVKLQELKNKQIQQVNVVHIGDSHIQADFMSGKVRVDLQRAYGNAGRGLVFPYHVAESNSPPDIYSKSNYKWDAYRNVHQQHDYQIGISGFVIATTESDAYLKLALNDKNDMGGYGFNKITVFGPKKDDLTNIQFYTSRDRDVIENNIVEEKNIYYTVKSGDNLGTIAVKFNSSVSFIQKANHLKSTIIYPKQKLLVAKQRERSCHLSEKLFEAIQILKVERNANSVSYYFPQLMEFIFIKGRNNNKGTPHTQWDGFMLENTNSSGVLYHTIGVNGAKFKDYNNSFSFFKQLPDLKADLIIVSLGTNESLDTDLSEEDFKNAIHNFFQNLKNACPNAIILMSTPTDNNKATKKVATFAKLLEQYAINNRLAYFDYYEALGAEKSFDKLIANKLAQKDGVHLKSKGYEFLGKLMSEAIINVYNNYSINGNN